MFKSCALSTSQLCSRSSVRDFPSRTDSIRSVFGAKRNLVCHRQPNAPACAHMQMGRRPLLNRGLLAGILGTSLVQGFGLALPQMAAARGKPFSSNVDKVLDNVTWPDAWPYQKSDFQRFDESPDTVFYDEPRFVTHIDDAAIAALTAYYAKVFPESGQSDTALLDVCSSWISHYPEGFAAGRISGLGMNEEELARNPILSDFAVRDLNVNPLLPYEDNTFDVVTNTVSVDYLNKPLEMMKEVNRVLKPGGLAVMSFSNRCFPTKAISLWTATGDPDHVWIVGSYFHYAGGFTSPQVDDISPNPGRTDPMYVVYARKAEA
ncbi:hypothetical protein CYMTET_10369 [Cymbomonas tetramitiformis]|uniref:Methyltransferase type 11 domain-containing protein n=1 Tax=Cymbomonas tetramitiformis TaxID=36881 RepID=A0AAE0GPB2_9CHLO|nr:hypothetical protein CYMTET_10369 [Cymbomonas tetramitiformis]